MPNEITMPKLSDTMEEGTILRWLKQAGERVEKGDVLAEVETDKADMELEAEATGTLAEIRVKEGESAPVGAVLAILSNAEAKPARAQPAAASDAKPPQPPVSATREGAPHPPAAAKAPVPPPRAGDKQRSAPPPPPASTPSAPPGAQWKPRHTAEPPVAPHGRQEQSKLRLAVAKQMTASKRDAPHFYVTTEIDMSEAARLRSSLADTAEVSERITFTHFILRAVALTLLRHPRVNASWSEDSVTYHDDVNIGVAVALDDGLIAPVLRGAQRLSLRAIARAAADLVAKAQEGRFGGDALTGGTFTVSNMGMLDIEEFSAVIIPPQAAILAVGAIKDRPVVRNGKIESAKTMRATLSADHRVLNGVEAGRFLEDLKRTLENPVVLVMGED